MNEIHGFSRGMVQAEVETVRAALAASNVVQERLEFLTNWFQCHLAQHIAANPFKRGEFAREAGFTPAELGVWNRYCAGLRVIKAAQRTCSPEGRKPKSGAMGQLKKAVAAYEDVVADTCCRCGADLTSGASGGLCYRCVVQDDYDDARPTAPTPLEVCKALVAWFDGLGVPMRDYNPVVAQARKAVAASDE